MKNHFRWAAAAVCAAAPLVYAVETRSWVHNDRTDFEKGTLKGLSLRSDGRLTLAPQFREIADPATAYLWALGIDSKGTLYTGGGSPGSPNAKLTAIDSNGKSRIVTEVPGLQIQAIAVDRQDRVYAATAPDGKVYRIGAGGKPEVFYDPKTHYIWALAFSGKGDLFVATGDAGEIHRVTPDGTGSVFFRTEETHARSLAVDSQENLIAGTEPGGLVFRISPAGNGFVLYQTARREVTAVAVAKDGSVYAAATGSRTPGAGPAFPVTLAPPAPAPAPAAVAAAGPRPAPVTITSTPPPASPAPPPPPSGGSEVYRISPDGYPQRMWTNASDLVYTIAFDRDGRAVFGTGNKGNIYRIDSELLSTLLINSDPTQVTALVSGPEGKLFAATANVGKVYGIGPALETTGTYESDPLDAGSFAQWGRLSARADLHGGTVRFETRSGNLDRPQNNWSSWTAPDGSGRGTSPSSRFLQYRVTLASSGSATPELRQVEAAYKSKNVPPVISELEVTPANYRFAAPPTSTAPPSTTLNLPPIGTRRPAVAPVPIDTSISNTMNYAKGYSGARWALSDPNGDATLSRVEIRGIGEKEWKLLRDRMSEKYFSFDSAAFPDGDYVLRITATDVPDNPPDQALTRALESDRFIIDNTPPVISGLTATLSGNKLNVRWQGRDNRSIINKAEYSVNGGEWTVADPVSGLSDAPQLEYMVTLERESATEASVAVRLTDEYDNVSVAKTVVR